MTLNKGNGLSNSLKYHFHLFSGRGDLLHTSNLFFEFIAFWVNFSSDGIYIPFAGSETDKEIKPMF